MSTFHIVQEGTGLTISTEELRDRLGDPALTIVDVRPLAAYNGWRLHGEARGGHPGSSRVPGRLAASGGCARGRAPPPFEGH